MADVTSESRGAAMVFNATAGGLSGGLYRRICLCIKKKPVNCKKKGPCGKSPTKNKNIYDIAILSLKVQTIPLDIGYVYLYPL